MPKQGGSVHTNVQTHWGVNHFMFVTVDGNKEEIGIEEEVRLQEEARLEEEVEEEPNLSRDGWGKIRPEFVGFTKKVDKRPFPRWGRGPNVPSSASHPFNTTWCTTVDPPGDSGWEETEQEPLPLVDSNLYDKEWGRLCPSFATLRLDSPPGALLDRKSAVNIFHNEGRGHSACACLQPPDRRGRWNVGQRHPITHCMLPEQHATQQGTKDAPVCQQRGGPLFLWRPKRAEQDCPHGESKS